MSQRHTHFGSSTSLPTIRLATGVRLISDCDAHTGVVLTFGPGQVQLNKMAADILSLCDGSRDSEAIVTRIVAVTTSPVLGSDVREFLRAALARGWVICGH